VVVVANVVEVLMLLLQWLRRMPWRFLLRGGRRGGKAVKVDEGIVGVLWRGVSV
jgi:hypothetical protein